MTIIIATLSAMAADRMLEFGTIKHGTPKLFIHEGRIYGSAGCAALGARWRDLIVHGGDADTAWPSDAEEDDFEGLELGPDGIHSWGRWFTRVPMDGPCVAIGSARDLAIGALLAGANLRQAMEICCDRDTGCGRPIEIMELKKLQIEPLAA